METGVFFKEDINALWNEKSQNKEKMEMRNEGLKKKEINTEGKERSTV